MDPLAQRVAVLFAKALEKPSPEQVAQATKAGEEAFKAGKPRVPLHDPALQGLLEAGHGRLIGWSVPLLHGWLHGWDKANIAAPVPELVEDDPRIPRLERIMASVESEVAQMRAALDKYKHDSEKFKPQLDNLGHGASIVSNSLRVLLRTLGKE